MATVAVTKSSTIEAFPFLIKKYELTTGTTGLAITHGEDRAPDMIKFVNTTADPAAHELSAVRTSATVITVDAENDTADSFEMYLFWLSQASGGIS
jgi:hypothetical protein